MKKFLKEYFEKIKVEYFSVISYSDCRVTASRIIERESFTPRSVIIFLLPYYTGETVNISRYAASRDYHLVIKEVGEGLCECLAREYKGANMHIYGDHSPIDERHAALIAGLGILGDNGLIINEKYGSYIFVGDVITDIDPEELCAVAPSPIKRCEGCGVCKSSCPTGALSGKSTECLSAITQKKGELTEDECALMRKYNTAWGCDECQRYCPHNLLPPVTPIEFFRKDPIYHLTREVLDNMNDDEFSRRAFAWRKRKTVERNLDILAKK